jgi:hypothetical protein
MLYVLRGPHDAEVADDLRVIVGGFSISVALNDIVAPDPDGGAPATMSGNGRVTFRNPAPPMQEPGEFVVRTLAELTDVSVYLRGEGPGWEYVAADGPKKLYLAAGITQDRTRNGLRLIMITYDVTGCLDVDGGTKGYSVKTTDGGTITNPKHVILFHELVHAYRKVTATETPAAIELQVIKDHPGENDYRLSRSLPPRAIDANAHFGFPNCALAGPPSQKPVVNVKGGDCFVATAAYGSAIETPVQFLREVRDNILMPTRAGRAFFETFYEDYYVFSPAIADAMRADSSMRNGVRIALVEPLVRYLDLFLAAPEGSVEHLPEPWRSHLLHEQETFDTWAANFELDSAFPGLTPVQIADELAVYLRYLLRNPERRERYLARLEAEGSIPVHTDAAQAAQARTVLTNAGRPATEIDRIITPPPQHVLRVQQRRSPAASELRANMNVDEQPDPGQNPKEFLYTITLRNSTQIASSGDPNDALPTTIDFRAFYKRVNLPGVVYYEALNVQPGHWAVIPLGVASQMEAYAFGAWASIYVGGAEQYGYFFLSGQDLTLNGQPIGDITAAKAAAWAAENGVQDAEQYADSYQFFS